MQLTRYKDRWDPFGELEDLSDRVNRIFGLTKWPTTGEESLALTDWMPPCNVIEAEKEYRIRLELPGVKREDVHTTLDNGVLTIRGTREKEKEEKGLTMHRRECVFGHFMRRFTMPEDADPGSVTARFTDGILDVTVAKTTVRAPTAREIKIG